MTCKAIANQLTARYDLLKAAVSKDDTRPALKHIYCDGKNIISTNGNILVFTENMESLEPGFYDLCTIGTGKAKTSKFVPVTDEKAKDWKFPDWKRIIPNCTNAKQIEFRASSIDLELEVFKLQSALASCGSGALLAQQNINLLCKHSLIYTIKIVDGYAPLLIDVPNLFSMLMMPKRGSKDVNAIIADLTKTANPAPEPPAEPKVTIEPAPEVKPEPVAEQQPEPPATVEPAPEPAPAPQPAPQKTAKAAKPKQKPRQRKATPKASKTAQPKPSKYLYICSLRNGKTVTLDSIDAVQARNDVKLCHITPNPRYRKYRKHRKAA